MVLTGLAWGEVDAPPVLALHGWLDNAASFIPMAPRLKNYRLVALDLPGHGFSEHRPAGCHYHFIDYLTEVLLAADKLGWDRFRLLGHSLGGAIALCTAAVANDRIEQIALIESIGPYVGVAEEAPERWQTAHKQMLRTFGSKAPFYTDMDVIVRARLAATPMSERAARLILERGMKRVEEGFSWRADVRLRVNSPMYLSEEQVRAYIRSVRAPGLLIRGQGSAFSGKKVFIDRQAGFSQLQVVDLPGEHHLHMDTPVIVAKSIDDFFAGN